MLGCFVVIDVASIAVDTWLLMLRWPWRLGTAELCLGIHLAYALAFAWHLFPMASSFRGTNWPISGRTIYTRSSRTWRQERRPGWLTWRQTSTMIGSIHSRTTPPAIRGTRGFYRIASACGARLGGLLTSSGSFDRSSPSTSTLQLSATLSSLLYEAVLGVLFFRNQFFEDLAGANDRAPGRDGRSR